LSRRLSGPQIWFEIFEEVKACCPYWGHTVISLINFLPINTDRSPAEILKIGLYTGEAVCYAEGRK